MGAVFTRLGKQSREAVRGEIGQLVNVHEKWNALSLGNIGARHREQLKMRDDKRAQQIGRCLPYRAFAQISDENSAIIHRVAEVKARRVLAQYVAQYRRSRKLPHL